MESKFMQLVKNIEHGIKNIAVRNDKCTIVSEYAYTEDPNPFARAQMEDRFCHWSSGRFGYPLLPPA